MRFLKIKLIALITLTNIFSCSDDDETALTSAPTITNQVFTIPEDASIGTTVGVVIASDADGDQLTFTITAGNIDNVFEINSVTGEIVLNGTLDFETVSAYSLTVQVADSEGNATADITINVTDIDENTAPTVADQTFTIPENSSTGTIVGTVVASDVDGNTLTFSIPFGNDAGGFQINESTGEISVESSSALDFETTPIFNLTVEVTDGVLITSAAITINLSDVVDTSPFIFTTRWGSLGTADNQLDASKKIVATDDFLFINDVGNAKIKKFDHEGNFLASLNFSSPFYVFDDRLYVVSDTNNTYLHKFDLDFNLVESFNFSEPIPSGDDISGNDSKALVMLGGTTEPFLMSLDFVNLTQNSFGVLGTGELGFQWNGQFNLVFENGNNEIPAAYFVTDGGNSRVQELDENFNFVDEFSTDGSNRGVLNSPSIIEANQEYITITNGSNAGDQIDFYDRSTNEFLFTHEVGNFFQQSISFNGDTMFVLVNFPAIEVRIYNK